MRADTPQELEALVMGLALQSLVQMRDPQKAPFIPALYAGRIRYQQEPIGREQWQSAFESALHRTADCEDLVAFRLAELWRTREDVAARPYVKVVNPSLRHVLVRRGNGVLEDPSKKLGMRG